MQTVRLERPDDRDAIDRVQRLAFGRAEEAALVHALRDAGAAVVSLVAEDEGTVVGHALLSPVSIAGHDGAGLGLGPIGVLPGHQRRGIGSSLVRRALEECRRLGHSVVVVLGGPEFYARFGFVPAAGHGLRCEYDVPEESFMVARLAPVALREPRGLVRYHSAFADV